MYIVFLTCSCRFLNIRYLFNWWCFDCSNVSIWCNKPLVHTKLEKYSVSKTVMTYHISNKLFYWSQKKISITKTIISHSIPLVLVFYILNKVILLIAIPLLMWPFSECLALWRKKLFFFFLWWRAMEVRSAHIDAFWL